MEYKCRLCLTESFVEDCMTNIFQHQLRYSDATIIDNLYWIFSIEVDASDLYTKNICHDCLNFLENILKSRQVFQNNQRLLKYQYEESEKICKDLELQKIPKLASKQHMSAYVPFPSYNSGPLMESSVLHANLKSNSDIAVSHPITKFEDADLNLEEDLLEKINQACKMEDNCKDVDDWTKKSFKKDVGTNTRKIKILPENCASVSFDILNKIGPKVQLEPIDKIIKKKNYKKISKKTYIKINPKTKDDLKSEREHKNIWTEYVNYYYAIKTLAIRELILGKRIAEDDLKYKDSASLCNVTNSEKVFVCNICSTVFTSHIMLKQHNKKKHRQALSSPSSVDSYHFEIFDIDLPCKFYSSSPSPPTLSPVDPLYFNFSEQSIKEVIGANKPVTT